MAVRRIKNSESVLDSLKERGFDVGKSTREYGSPTLKKTAQAPE